MSAEKLGCIIGVTKIYQISSCNNVTTIPKGCRNAVSSYNANRATKIDLKWQEITGRATKIDLKTTEMDAIGQYPVTGDSFSDVLSVILFVLFGFSEETAFRLYCF